MRNNIKNSAMLTQKSLGSHTAFDMSKSKLPEVSLNKESTVVKKPKKEMKKIFDWSKKKITKKGIEKK